MYVEEALKIGKKITEEWDLCEWNVIFYSAILR